MKTVRPHLLATALFLVVTVLLLGPLDPSKEVWGGEAPDVFNHLHILDWQARAAAGGRLLPTHDPLLHYPDGGTIFVADPIGHILFTPLVWLTTPVVGANALVLTSLVFACWAMFWLVRRLTDSTPAALLAGLVFGLNPTTLGHVHNGVWELLQTGWLPLFVGCWWTVVRSTRDRAEAGDGSGRKGPWLAMLATVAAWSAAALASHWYYGMYAGVLFGLLLLTEGLGPRRARIGLHAGIVTVATAACLAPAIWLFVRSTHSELAITRGLQPGDWAPFKAADPAFFFSPRPALFDLFLHLTYPSISVLALSAICLVFAVHRRRVAAWLGAAAFFVALSIGPTLVWEGEAVALGAMGWLLPHRVFDVAIPVFDSMEFPYRFFVMVHLCLALAIGVGFAALRLRPAYRWPLAAAFGMALLLELSTNSGVPVPMDRQVIEPTGPADAVGRAPGEFAVLDLPVRMDIWSRHRYVVNQLFHERPILYSNFPTKAFPFTASVAEQSLVANLARMADDPRGLRDSPWSEAPTPFSDGAVQQQSRRLLSCLLGERPCDAGDIDSLDRDLQRMFQRRITHFALHEDLLHPDSKLPELCDWLFGPPATRADPVTLHVLGEARGLDAESSWGILGGGDAGEAGIGTVEP